MKKFAILSSVMVGLFSMASIAVAQTTAGGAEQVPYSTAGASNQEQQVREFGTSGISILQIGAVSFGARTAGATLNSPGNGLSTPNSTGFFPYWAPVNLPTGARISWLDLYACDNNATGGRITAYLTRYLGSTTPLVNDIAFVQSTQGAGTGCGYWAKLLNHTVNNDVQYGGGGYYAVNLQFGAIDGSNRIKGVDLWWQRQVTPAPATASFGDVPTGHWAFQWIEALRASGITSGCAAGVYCPDNNVTRAEMAVFLSRALGLHWPH